MKRIIGTALAILLTCTLVGCTNNHNVNTATPMGTSVGELKAASPSDTKTLVTSYYQAQSSPAFSMLQHNIFKNWVENWSDETTNPKWNFETFAQYQILDKDTMSAVSDQDLYYCTISADNDKYGYIVVEYHGDSLSRGSENIDTPYPYDLNVVLADVSSKLAQTDIEMPTAVASRVSIVDTTNNSPEEAIMIKDGKGQVYVYSFNDRTLTKR